MEKFMKMELKVNYKIDWTRIVETIAKIKKNYKEKKHFWRKEKFINHNLYYSKYNLKQRAAINVT